MIGIDMEDQNIYALQLKQAKSGLTIGGMWQRECDGFDRDLPDQDETFIALLRGIRKSKRFRGRRVAIHLPSQNIISFPIRFQTKQTEALDERILQEVQEHLSFPIEEAVVDYPSIKSVTSGAQTDHTATIVAAHRDNVSKYISALARAGLVVEAIDLGVASLVRLHNRFAEATGNTVVLCNIGFRQSLLTVVSEDSILAQRYFTWGFRMLLDRILANLELDAGMAESLLDRHGLAYETRGGDDDRNGISGDEATVSLERALYQITTPYIDELIYEFHTITSYVRSEEKVSSFAGIHMYGYANLLRHLDSYLEKRLGIPVQVMNPLSQAAVSGNNVQPDPTETAPFALALGLAMRMVPWL